MLQNTIHASPLHSRPHKMANSKRNSLTGMRFREAARVGFVLDQLGLVFCENYLEQRNSFHMAIPTLSWPVRKTKPRWIASNRKKVMWVLRLWQILVLGRYWRFFKCDPLLWYLVALGDSIFGELIVESECNACYFAESGFCVVGRNNTILLCIK